MRKKRILRESIRTAIATLLLLAVSLLTFAWFHHARPTRRESAGRITATPTPPVASSAIPTPEERTAAESPAPLDEATPAAEATPDPRPWSEQYAERFSAQVISDESTYRSPDLSITITTVQYGDVKSAMYYLADIYLTDVTQFGTVLAEDSFGSGLRESVKSMGKRSGAIIAVTGDTYGNQDAGIVIRNGVVHRQEKSAFDICVLYYDGVMKTYSPDEFSIEQAISDGAYQAWSFGPLLLDTDGRPLAEESMNTSKNIRRANPRTCVGYYGPGHYCFIVVDGRTDDASGLTLEEMSELFAELGCKAAYNMDGGRSAEMFFNGKIMNDPYKGGRSVSDCLIIRETNNGKE